MTVHTHDGDITAEPEEPENIFLAYSNAASSLRKLGEMEKAIHFMNDKGFVRFCITGLLVLIPAFRQSKTAQQKKPEANCPRPGFVWSFLMEQKSGA